MTMNDVCDGLIAEYLEQLHGGFEVTPTKTGCFVVTPFVRPDGAALELAVESYANGHVRLTDMGDTLGYLYVNGLTLSRDLLDNAKRISRRFGVSIEGAQLVIEAGAGQQPGEALHWLTQAAISVTDLIQKRRPVERIHFEKEVEALIVLSGAVYDGDYEVAGRDSKHRVQFHVDSNRNMLIQALSPASEPAAYSWAERWAYRFGDILEYNSSWRCRAILDDRGGREGVWSDRALAPLGESSILWSGRTQLVEELT